MRKQTRIILAVLISAGFGNLMSQNTANLIAKLNYEKSDGVSNVKGWFKNNQTLPAVFKYVFTVAKKDTSSIKESTFRADSGQKVNLSKAVLFFRKKDEIKKIKLEIFRYGKLVAADSVIIEIPKTRVTESNEKSPHIFPPPISSNESDLEIDGLILDETRSKIGHDFYEYFYAGWSAPEKAKGFIITIRELPSRGIGAQIAVEVNNQTLTKQFLQPRADLIEGMAGQIVNLVKDHLNKLEDLNSQILSEDIQGSGIY